MHKLFASILVVSGAALSLGCPRFHAECVGGEWNRTVVTTGSGSSSGPGSQSTSSSGESSSTEASQGCAHWLCRDGYLRQADSCVKTCDTSEYAANGRWCVRKCPKGLWAKDDECVATCGNKWLYKEDPARQCVEWCEDGYVAEGDKCVKPPVEARAALTPRRSL